jgi:hypothetical protein
MENANDEHSAAPLCYPALSEYSGGCSILNGHTTVKNVLAECRDCTPEVSDEVFRLLCAGHEVFCSVVKLKLPGRIDG